MDEIAQIKEQLATLKTAYDANAGTTNGHIKNYFSRREQLETRLKELEAAAHG